jgi:hypothetical protein
MVIGKKKRDVKFIIYQTLYILVIAMLGAKHVTINDIPDALKQGDTVMQITNLESLNRELDSLKKLSVFDSLKQVVLKKPGKDSEYTILSTNETIVSKSELDELRRRPTKIPPQKQSKENPQPKDPGVLIPDQ